MPREPPVTSATRLPATRGRTRRAVLENHDPSLSFQNQRPVLVGTDHADDQRARRFGLVRDRDHELDLIVNEHGHEKIKLLLEPQRAGAGQARADDAGEIRRRQHAVGHALAEPRLRRKRLVHVQRVVVARHARERIDGIRGEAAPHARLIANLDGGEAGELAQCSSFFPDRVTIGMSRIHNCFCQMARLF